MSRPFPWLSRLSDIRRRVAGSVRSHYGRRELEVLFGVGKSAAGRLLELLGTERIGSGVMVQRETLYQFLDQVGESEDVTALCARIRAERENLSRVKSRYLLVRDEHEVPVASLPVSIRVEPGLVSIAAATVEELCQQLCQLSQAMRDDPLAFEARFEAGRKPVRSAEAEDARWIAGEIERMKATGRVA